MGSVCHEYTMCYYALRTSTGTCSNTRLLRVTGYRIYFIILKLNAKLTVYYYKGRLMVLNQSNT